MPQAQRIQFAQASIPSHTALFLSDPLDILYLTDFLCLTPEEREAYVFLTNQSAILFLSSFSTPPQINGLQVQVGGIERLLKEQLRTLCNSDSVSSISVDGNSLRLNEYELLKSILPESISIKNSPTPPLQEQRMMKDEIEIEYISQANHLTHLAIEFTLRHLHEGMTELEVQEIFENQLKKMEVKEFAFPTIIAFGDHTALPHHQPTTRKLTPNTAVLIDCGAKWHGYCADVTRTMWFGDSPDPEFQKIEATVKQAYALTVKGLTSSDRKATTADNLARDYITTQGYGREFIHTTGHGVGLYIHEQPSLNPRNETPLQENMIITVEPGIYLPGKFGVRIEDMGRVTKTGYENFTRVEK
jgi:Xaa-Pro aminopeptidase